jgi:hypothetical protein
MAIDLKPEQRVIDLALQSGTYMNPDELPDRAFEIIRGQLDLEDWARGEVAPTLRAAVGKPGVAN